MSMSKYADIIKRLIEANGPNYALDARIWLEVVEKPEGERDRDMIGREPGYTASLRDALGLAERMLDGEWIDIGGIMGRPSRAQWECNIHTDYCETRALAPTAPLAVLLATFRTLEAKDACDER
jgi:hypothetical protein